MPAKIYENAMRIRGFKMSDELHDMLRRHAALEERSMSQVIRRAVERYIADAEARELMIKEQLAANQK